MAWALSVPSAAQELTADRLLAADHVVEIAIELAADDWSTLRQQTRDIRTAFMGGGDDPFTYFKGDVTIDGVKIGSVGVRKKGFIGSLDNRWPSLKIKFDQHAAQAPVAGLETLTLNNNKQDTSLVSQFLAYQVFNSAGVQAPRANFARVTVNGEFLGVYSHVETIGKPFLKQRFGDESGRLYEGTLADFYPSAIDRLEAKNKTANDRGKVVRLSTLLAAKQDLAIEEIEQIVDLPQFLRYWAVESLIGLWDGYSNNQNNYWVYENPRDGKLNFIPWGADAAFTAARSPFGFGTPGASSVYAESMLANRLFHADGVAERYRQTMRQLLENVWKEDELVQMVDRAESQLKGPWHERQSGAPAAMNNVRQFIRSRREAVVKELDQWPVQVAAQPRRPTYTVDVGAAKGTFATEWTEKPHATPLEAGRATIQLELDGKTVAFKQLGATANLAQMPAFPFNFNPPPNPAAPGDPPRIPPGIPPGLNAPGASPPNNVAARGEPPRAAPPPNAPPGAAPADRPRMPDFGGGPFGQFQPPATIVFTGTREADDKKLTLTLTIDPTVFGASAGKTIAALGTVSEGEGGFNLFMPFGNRSVEGKLTMTKVGMKPGDAIEGEFEVKVVETRGGFMDRAMGR